MLKGDDVEVHALAVAPIPRQPGSWRVTWQVRNLSGYPLALHEAWQPHGKFRGSTQPLSLPPLAPGDEARFELPVRFAQEMGAEVENAFLILRVTWGTEPRRILTRLLVTAGQTGQPHIQTVLVTTQPIGFASES